MKKHTGLLLLILMVASLILTNNLLSGYKERPRLRGVEHSISFEYVNFRTEPNTNAEVITRLYNGKKVETTGRIYEEFFDDIGYTAHWTEITVDGVTGWVVSKALD